MLGINSKVAKRITEFAARNEISFSQMKDMVMSGQPLTIYTTKKDGRNMVRDMFLIPGTPSGRAMNGFPYWDRGYMIMWDEGKNNYRTIIFRNIEKIKTLEGKTFYVN